MGRRSSARNRRITKALALVTLVLLVAAFATPSVRQTFVYEARRTLSCHAPTIITRPTGAKADTFLASLDARLSALPRPGPGYSYRFDHYPTSREIVQFLEDLRATFPDWITVEEIGSSWQGRPIFAAQLAIPADLPPTERPALYLDGQHHAREAISALVVLYTLWYLAEHADESRLLQDALATGTVYVVPSVNPDGNDIFLADNQWQRKNANPTIGDDDGDGQLDEDPPAAQGYGFVTKNRLSFDQQWLNTHAAYPLAPGWQDWLVDSGDPPDDESDAARVTRLDDDNDGQIDEDPIGGVDLNRNYDSHWGLINLPVEHERFPGDAPFSEPESQAVRDFVLAHPNITLAVTYHSGSDILLHPWGWSPSAPVPDRLLYEILSRHGAGLTERNGFAAAPYGSPGQMLYAGGGSSMDWMYARGILAWTPEVYAGPSVVHVERIAGSNTYTVTHSYADQFNPPPDEILLTVDRWLPWNLHLLEHLGKTSSVLHEPLESVPDAKSSGYQPALLDRFVAQISLLWKLRCR